jgi:CHAT domain-containing protein
MQEVTAVDDQLIEQVFSFATERQRLAFLARQQPNFDVYLSLVWQYFSESKEVVRAAADFVLRHKGISAEVLALQRDAVISGRFPNLQPQLAALTALRWELVEKNLRGPANEGMDYHKSEIEHLSEEKEKLEAALAAAIPELKLKQTLRAADREAVARALPEHSALIEFVRFYVYRATKGSVSFETPRYMAFVLMAREPESLQLIDLGEAEPIDRLISAFREMTTGGDVRGIQNASESNEAEFLTTSGRDGVCGADLRKRLFDPIARFVKETKRLILAPDGDLWRLPFEVLPTDDGRYLIDRYRISYLSVGRDVLRLDTAISDQMTDPLVIADPDFDLDDVQVGNATGSPDLKGGRLSRDLSRNNLRFGRLPGSRIEGQQVAQMMGVEPWLAGAALEARLKQRRSPRILHMATHGYFLPDQERNLKRQQHSLEEIASRTNGGLGRFAGPGLENPLLRSGLALAGVNTWLQQGNVSAEAEDGILTAEDVSGLDLLATELVVLSACETGLGEIHVGEGVFGLRRAFVLAGAKSLIMSLWKVSDLSTAILMERLYRNLLDRHFERDRALSDAQLHTRDITVGLIRERWLTPEAIDQLAGEDTAATRYLQRLARKSDDYQPFQHPYFWGAFVCQGDFHSLPANGSELEQ